MAKIAEKTLNNQQSSNQSYTDTTGLLLLSSCASTILNSFPKTSMDTSLNQYIINLILHWYWLHSIYNFMNIRIIIKASFTFTPYLDGEYS